MATPQEEQVARNFEAFVRELPGLLGAQAGRFALMRDAMIVEFFDTARDAYAAGSKLYSDGLFSIQEVTDAAVDLGFFSHAVPRG